MKILFIGYPDSALIPYLREQGNEVQQTIEPLTAKFLQTFKPDWIISYGYRHIIKKEILDLYPDRFINLHIALLPWNRGVDPNPWSWIENTPKGVTVHYIDPGVDTGDIIAQREISFDEGETLTSSYAKLRAEMEKLFREIWPAIVAGKAPRHKQKGVGSFHRLSDHHRVEAHLTKSWDTPVRDLKRKSES